MLCEGLQTYPCRRVPILDRVVFRIGVSLPPPGSVSDGRDPQDLIGLPWAYRFDIKAGYNLPLTCASAYCQYDLLGETFTTETVQPDPASHSPALNYSFVHRVDKVRVNLLEFREFACGHSFLQTTGCM